MHKSTSNIEKLASGIFLVAVDGGWSDWSQWSHCTRNINGIQVRIRQCVNPNPQSGRKPCPGPDVTVIRGCTNISRCREGISQMLKNLFAYYPMPHHDFLSLIHSYYLGILSHNFLSDLTVRLPSTFGTVYRDRLWRYLTQCNDMGKHGKKSVYSLSQTKKLSFASDRIWW